MIETTEISDEWRLVAQSKKKVIIKHTSAWEEAIDDSKENQANFIGRAKHRKYEAPGYRSNGYHH